ncbi:MAG: L-aspartate oxidase [Oscillospiraceae bacterium]|jgi:L-aspartate oxidase|nr:L-aspartate oxidase [Oscillospiraceae bacterium]
MQATKYDVVIIGAGTAGLYAALQFDERYKVLLVSKRELSLSNSALAQGGVAAVIDKSSDTYKSHIADTLIAGGYKNDLAALEVLVTEGPADVMRIKEMGVSFDLDSDGRLQMTLEGGHSRRRIVHHKDSTGAEIVKKLAIAVRQKGNVEIWENALAYSLQKDEQSGGFFTGILYKGERHRVFSGYTVLATGGIGRVFQYTTNSAIATGDGIAMAYQLGAQIKNLSLVQFHPTAFSGGSGRERFLISEAVRGEGAVLLNGSGNRFVERYDYRGELAPRDVVSRAILMESKAQGSEDFYLDISAQDADFVKNRFPMIYERCLEEGVDITKQSIPIFPCMHYLMGGINVDTKARTNLTGLYAVGECAHTGVHGSNRLASNSLLEALVFSRRAAQDIILNISMNGYINSCGEAPPEYEFGEKPIPSGLRTEIRQIVQSSYFITPDIKAAAQGIKRIEAIKELLRQPGYALTPDYVEARSFATVAYIILQEVLAQ